MSKPTFTKKKIQNNSYQLDKAVYQGHSSIFLGINQNTNRRVAIKVINIKGMAPTTKKLLNNQISMLNSLRYVYSTANNAYLILQDCDKDFVKKPKQLHQTEIWSILRGLTTALSNLQCTKVVHNAINPSNILSKGGVLKLSDFGQARQIDSQDKEVLQQPPILKNDPFQAPQVRQKGIFSFKSDIWSLGVFALYLSTQPSRDNDLITKIAKRNFPVQDQKLRAFIDICIQYKPQLRPLASQLIKKFFEQSPLKRITSKSKVELLPGKVVDIYSLLVNFCIKLCKTIGQNQRSVLLFLIFKLIIISMNKLADFITKQINVFNAIKYDQWLKGIANIQASLIQCKQKYNQLQKQVTEYIISRDQEVQNLQPQPRVYIFIENIQQKQGFYLILIEQLKLAIKAIQPKIQQTKYFNCCDLMLTLFLVLGQMISHSDYTLGLLAPNMQKINKTPIIESTPYLRNKLKDKIKRLVE